MPYHICNGRNALHTCDSLSNSGLYTRTNGINRGNQAKRVSAAVSIYFIHLMQILLLSIKKNIIDI